MLSRYNGIGSLKLSIATAQNRRTSSNIYINDVPHKGIQSHQMDVTDATYAEIPSECSATLEPANTIRKSSKTNHMQNRINDLKLNGRFNLSRKMPKNRPNPVTSLPNAVESNAIDNGRKQKCIPKITSTNSIYSTSTISNSSLKEYELSDDNLDTTELAKYMRQINKEIHHDTK